MLIGTGLIVATSVAAGGLIGTGAGQMAHALNSKTKPAVRALFLSACLGLGAASGVLMADAKNTPVQAQTLVIR